MINHTLNDINKRNAAYIIQIERLNEELNEELNEGLRAKKRWQKATLYSVVLNVTFLGTLYVLNR